MFAFLVPGTGLLEVGSGMLAWPRAMAGFMGGLFRALAFLQAARRAAVCGRLHRVRRDRGRWRAYAVAYRFLELLLGAADLSGFQPTLTNPATLVVTSVGTEGVERTVLVRRTIRCVCLGAVFNLPMSCVTLAGEAMMAAMAAVMLVGGPGQVGWAVVVRRSGTPGADYGFAVGPPAPAARAVHVYRTRDAAEIVREQGRPWSPPASGCSR